MNIMKKRGFFFLVFIVAGLIYAIFSSAMSDVSDKSDRSDRSDIFTATGGKSQAVTPTPTPSTDLYKDNSEPNVQVNGPWALKNASSPDVLPNYYRDDYLIINGGTGTNTVVFPVYFSVSGTYFIFELHPHGANNTTQAQYKVDLHGFVATYYVDQTVAVTPGVGIPIGVQYFYGGNWYNVTLTDKVPAGEESRQVVGDAIRFLWMSAATPTPTPTATPTETPTPISTKTPTPTHTKTPTPTPIVTTTPSPTPSPTPILTATPTPYPTFTPMPTYTPTPSPTPTPPPTPTRTPAFLCPPPDPDQSPDYVTRAPGGQIIRDVEFNDDNKYVYCLYRYNDGTWRYKICWYSYDEIKTAPVEVSENFIPDSGDFMYMTRSEKPRYIGTNRLDATSPWVEIYRCENDGSLTRLAHRIAPDALYPLIPPDYTITTLTTTKRGCVSPLPASVYLPVDASVYDPLYPEIDPPLSFGAQVFGFLKAVEPTPIPPPQPTQSVTPTPTPQPTVYPTFFNFQPIFDYRYGYYASLYQQSLMIGNLFFGYGRVIIPMSTNPGAVLVAYPYKDTGLVTYRSPSDRETGVERVDFGDAVLHFSSNLGLSLEAVFHPTDPVAFIPDTTDSGLCMIDLSGYSVKGLYWYRGQKFIHPLRPTEGTDDKSLKIAISGDGNYVAIQSATNRAIYCWKLKKDDKDRWTAEPVSVFAPTSGTFNYNNKFVLGYQNGIYVSDGTNILYSHIEDDSTRVITAPDDTEPLVNATAGGIWADGERKILACRAFNTDGKQYLYFFKIGNWNYTVEFVKPKLGLNSDCLFRLPLNTPASIVVKIRTIDGKTVANSDVEVNLYYTIYPYAGGEAINVGPIAMQWGDNEGEFKTEITPTTAGDITLRGEVNPKDKPNIVDKGKWKGKIRDNDDPFVTITYVGPRHVIVPERLPSPYKCMVQGEVFWGKAYDWDEKYVSVILDNTGLEKKQYFRDKGRVGSITDPFFYEPAGQLPYDQYLQFDVQAFAKKLPNQQITSELIPFTYTNKPMCVVSWQRIVNNKLDGHFSSPLGTWAAKFNDPYYLYSYSENNPPGEKTQWNIGFKGKDLQIVGITIPVIEDIEFGIGGKWKDNVQFRSDYDPLSYKGEGEMSLQLTIPVGVAKVDTSGKASIKTAGLSICDCYYVIKAGSQKKITVEGDLGAGISMDAFHLLRKIKMDKILKLLGNRRILKFLKDCLSFRGGFDLIVNVEGYYIKDLSQYLGFRLEEMDGYFKPEVAGEIKTSLKEGWAEFQASVKANMVLSATDYFASRFPVRSAEAYVTGSYKFLKWLEYQDQPDKPWLSVKWPTLPGGLLGEPVFSSEFIPSIYLPIYTDQVMRQKDNKVLTRLLTTEAEQTLVTDAFTFTIPRQATTGNKRMVVYTWAPSDVPHEQALELKYIYFENGAIASQGAITNDTRVQDSEDLIATPDGKFLLACVSCNVDGFTLPGEDYDQNLQAAAPHLEIASAKFDTGTKTWSALNYLTNNSTPDYEPHLFMNHENKVMLLYSAQTNVDYTASPTAPETIKYSVYDGSSFGAPQTVISNIKSPVVYDCAAYASKTWLVISRDADDDELTTPDTHLYAMSYKGSTPAWDATPTELTTGALFDESPCLMKTADGSPLLAWQRNDQLVYSIGEPLAANPVFLTDGQGDGNGSLVQYQQLPNGDFLIFSYVVSPWNSDPDAPVTDDIVYDYVEPEYGSWGPTRMTCDEPVEMKLSVASLSNDAVSALYTKRELFEDKDGIPIFGKTSIVLKEFTPQPQISNEFTVQMPGDVKQGKTFQIDLIATRTLKIYSCDFKLTMPEGITIQSLTPSPLLTGATDAGNQNAFIRRTGALPDAVIPAGTSIATLQVKVAADAPMGVREIILSDEDGGLNYMTTETIGVSFAETHAPITVYSSLAQSWRLY